MNTYIFLFLVGFFSSMIFLTTYQVFGESINEDQVIICVNNSDGIPNNGLICHLYDTDKVDWYQDISDGTFFKCGDCFDMEVLD